MYIYVYIYIYRERERDLYIRIVVRRYGSKETDRIVRRAGFPIYS